MIENKVFIDNLQNISKQENNYLKAEFIRQKETFSISIEDMDDLVSASHFLFCSVKDLDTAFYSLFS